MTAAGRTTRHAIAAAALLMAALEAAAAGERVLGTADYLAAPRVPPDRRLAYGPGPSQFGELSLPAGSGPHPVVVVLHGGCWSAAYGLEPLGAFCRRVADEAKAAVFSLEYRRVGEAGGGFPGTFLDVARGIDHLASLAAPPGLDLSRVVAVGHSAGGQLALWLAARHRVPGASEVHAPPGVRLTAVVALAPLADLRAAAARRLCGDAVPGLLGEDPHGTRLSATSPASLLPLGVRQVLVSGLRDTIVPAETVHDYAVAARAHGDVVTEVELPDAGHFELVTPSSTGFGHVLDAIRGALGRRP